LMSFVNHDAMTRKVIGNRDLLPSGNHSACQTRGLTSPNRFPHPSDTTDAGQNLELNVALF
jgi:hypothetical protein